jgi:hypothetical protein
MEPYVLVPWQDHRYPGSHRSLLDDQRSLAGNDRRLSDLHPGDVGDRIPATRLQPSDLDSEVSRPNSLLTIAAGR